jgi:transposase
LQELERLSRLGLIDLYYGDESRVCTEPCIPYGWQFKGENVFMPSAKGKGLNLFDLLGRNNDFFFKTTPNKLDSAFVVEQLETLAFAIRKVTVVPLDNAAVHTSSKFQERRHVWEQRGLFIFYLPPYSPHLNLSEILWRQLKYLWLKPQDYCSEDDLFYATTQCLAAVGNSLTIVFSQFNLGSR